MKNVLLLLLLISQISIAQNTLNFDSEDYYFLKRTEHLKVSMDKGKLDIVNSVFEQAKYNSANNLFFANDFIHFDSFTDITDIEAYTQTPTSKIKVDHFETKDQFGGSVFFSDQQSINFVFPAVGKDAVTTLQYNENIKDPHFLGTFRFGTFAPTKEATYTVEVPNNVELGYKTFNLDSIDITFEKTESKKTTTYTWKANNIEHYIKDDKSLSILNYLPHIIVYIKNYKIKKETQPVLNDVADLYSWYVSLTNQIDRSNLEEVFSIADGLVSNLNTESEKAKAIFNWVQSNITYVAFEDGLGGFIPRGAASVCNKRYGDCKDMANILYEMLNHVGIKAYHTWIGTRDRPYSYYDVPTPMVDNHMITAAIINNETIFLDATDSYVPYGMPSSFTQSKEALIGISPDEYKIIKVPIQPKEKNISSVETVISMENDIVKATGKRILKGYEMVDFVYDAKFKKDDKTDEEYLNNKFQIGNNKTTYTNIDLGELTTKKDSYILSYDLEISNYAKKIGSKVYINLNLEKPLSKDIIITENQKFGKKIDHKYIRNYTTIFNIPDGYKVKSIPDNMSNKMDDYGYTFEFKQEGNQLILDKSIYMNIIAIKKEQYDDYNTFIKTLIKAYKKSIILEKI
ncbi:DUF3857 domain-containing protein [Urechidicola croceus]|uniref:Transglutaminase-like domain-containing protein n=1 Tax=Urechidicola croceus TaxID=1850246 RepID=A0A1D8P6P0_9FLAO|nr:transglutaminase domain-containing protein [Urechidicola croceus]AOW20233.1 hypothetical protein LPB138_05880 [Urechidicola croceus]